MVQQPVAVGFGGTILHRLPQICEYAEESALLFIALLRPVENQVLRFARQLLERRGQAESVSFCGQLQYVDEVLRRRAWSQSALQQRLRPVCDDLGRIEIVLAAQSVALRTRAVHA